MAERASLPKPVGHFLSLAAQSGRRRTPLQVQIEGSCAAYRRAVTRVVPREPNSRLWLGIGGGSILFSQKTGPSSYGGWSVESLTVAWDRMMAQRIRNMKASDIRDAFRLAERPDIISFAGGFPSADSFPREILAELASEIALERAGSALQYGPTEGSYELRNYVAEQMKQGGIAVDPENVLITGGSQQGLDLLSKVFLNEGDSVAVEQPAYIGGLSAFRNYGASLLGVPLDNEGMQVDHLEALLANRQRAGEPMPKLCYIIPNFQNPSGVTMSLPRRQRMVELAEAYDFLVIEDNPYGELRFEGAPKPHVKQFDSQGRVVYLGSFSKVFVPGVRVAWLAAAEPAVRKLAIAKQGTDLCGSSFGQRLVLEFCRRELLAPTVARLRSFYRQKRDLMLESMGRHFPNEVSWTYPEGGFFVWVTLPDYLDAKALLPAAVECERVAYVAGGAFFADGSGRNTIRLAFSQAADEQIADGIARLGRFLKTQVKPAEKEQAPPAVYRNVALSHRKVF